MAYYGSAFLIFYFLSFPAYSSDMQKCISKMRSGDVIFFVDIQDKKEKGFTDAVSKSYDSAEKITHTGLFYSKEGTKIIHALPGMGVIEHDVNELSYAFSKSNSHIVVKRADIDDSDIDKIVHIAHSYIGLPYNDIFSDNNLNSKGAFSFYCSQFVEQVYEEAIGKEFFKKHPMSFHNADGNEIPYWKSYFASRNLSVPEGDIGTHPGSLYESDKFSVVCAAEINYLYSDHNEL